VVIAPVNRRWLEQEQLRALGAASFAIRRPREGSWSTLRDRWEWANVGRAALALVGLVALLLGMRA
jgi:hypothetical protein